MTVEQTTGAGSADSCALPPRFAETVRLVDEALAADLDNWLARSPARLGEAIRYALLGPGKRIRPVLVLWSAELCGGPAGAGVVSAAVAVEMLHTYSLVHDDLPAMDDDDLRRGRPTCHVVYGQGPAILVGDALLTRAFEVLAGADLPTGRRARLAAVLADAAGACGMIAGQAEDLAHEQAGADRSASADLADVDYIHEHKTAALISAACRMGAIAAGADARAEAALGSFGRSLGLAFQIADDLLDALGLSSRLGKQAGKDKPAGKLTYPSVVGIEASRRAGESAAVAAAAALAELAAVRSVDQALLADLIAIGRYVIDRTR